MTRSVLYIDIETSPMIVYSWGLWKQDIAINQIIEPSRMLGFSAKWRGDKSVMWFSEYHDGREQMLQAARDLLDEAEVVSHWNGKTFDVPHINREIILGGLEAPSPFQQLDLMKAVKAKFRFPSYKLQYVSTALGLPGKVSHEGFGLWVKCLAGDEKAWSRMRTYAKRDTALLEPIHTKLLSWIDNGPHLALVAGKADSDGQTCGRCGTVGKLQSRGLAHTKLAAYQRYWCGSCKGWSRGKKAELYVDARAAS